MMDAQQNEQDCIDEIRKWDEDASKQANKSAPHVDRNRSKDFLKRFGKMVRRYRTQANHTQLEMAEAVNSPRTSFLKIEAGTLPHLPFYRGLLICRKLKIPLRLVIHECLEADMKR